MGEAQAISFANYNDSHINSAFDDDFDIDAIPVHIVRTASFQGLPGHEELSDGVRGIPAFSYAGDLLMDSAGIFDFSDNSMTEGYIPKPQLSKQTRIVDANAEFASEDFLRVRRAAVPPGVPEAMPYLLMKTHFKVMMHVSVIEEIIQQCLRDIPDVSINYMAQKCKVSMNHFSPPSLFF